MVAKGCLGSAFIELEDVKVSIENLIGQENEGFKVTMSSKRLHAGFRDSHSDNDNSVQSRKIVGWHHRQSMGKSCAD